MRQLAAIMFSDMSGYTALMQQNEQLAKDKRRRLKDVLETSVSVYNGKILQYYGVRPRDNVAATKHVTYA